MADSPPPGGLPTGLRIGFWLRENTAALLPKRHLQDFGEMKGMAIGALGDLLAATEAVAMMSVSGEAARTAGEEFDSPMSRETGTFFLEAKRPGHATASRGGSMEVEAETSEDGFFGGHLHNRLVVTVAVDEAFRRSFGMAKFGARFSMNSPSREFAQ